MEIVLALGLGVATFVGLVLVGWAVGRLLHATFDVSPAWAWKALVLTAAVAGAAVVVRHLALARRRGL